MTVPLSRIPLPRVAAFSSLPNPTEIWPAVLGLTFPWSAMLWWPLHVLWL